MHLQHTITHACLDLWGLSISQSLVDVGHDRGQIVDVVTHVVGPWFLDEFFARESPSLCSLCLRHGLPRFNAVRIGIIRPVRQTLYCNCRWMIYLIVRACMHVFEFVCVYVISEYVYTYKYINIHRNKKINMRATYTSCMHTRFLIVRSISYLRYARTHAPRACVDAFLHSGHCVIYLQSGLNRKDSEIL